jgi:two-component system, NarL family, sensor histidine kinase DevS
MSPPGDRMPAGDEERLGAVEAELAVSRRQVADLMAELEETNRGLIAFHRELEVARQAEAQLAAIVRSSEDAMYSMTPDLVITTWNPGAERLFGYAAAEMVGRQTVLVPGELCEEFDLILWRARSGRARTCDTRRLRKDGSLVDVAVTLSAMRDPSGTLIGYAAVARDITSRLRAEAELAEARAHQEVLADRDRMARELHDRVIGRIFAAGMSLQGVAAVVGRTGVSARVEAVIGELDRSIDEIREAIFGGRRGHAEPLGLRSAVLGLASETADALGFTPDVSFVGDVDDVPADVGAQLLAVIREALSNIARHAGATAAAVTLSAGPEVVLRVTDNGRGLGEVTRRSGLRNMRERAQSLGGAFEITSRPGAGTQLEWRIPRVPAP